MADINMADAPQMDPSAIPSPSAASDRNISALESPDTLIAQITAEISESERILSPWKNKLVVYYELYQMVQSHRHYEGLAKIFVPEVLRAVETVVGKLYQILVGSPNWFEFVGREESDDSGALAMNELIRYQMAENKFNPRVMDSLRQLAIAGVTIRKILWDFKQVRRQRVMMTPVGPQPMVELETINDQWTFEPVDLLKFHISDPTVPYHDIQKARYLAEQYLVQKQWCQEKFKKGWLSSVMKQKLEYDSKSPSSTASTLSDRRARASGFSDLSTKDKTEIIERWGLLQARLVHTPEEMEALGLQPDDEVETVCIIGNRCAILKLEANPFWHGQKPYVSCPYIAKEAEFDGMGVAEVARNLQEELNDTRNQTMDNKTLILMTMWLKSRASGIKNDQLRIRPMGVITTNDMTGLTALRPPVLTGVGVNIEGVIKEDLRQAVGASSNLQGIQTAGVDTATESSIINRESMGRLLMTAEMYSELILKPTLVMAEFLNYQFYDHTKVIKVIGEKGVKFKKLSPEEITGYKDVQIMLAVDAAENPAVRRQQIMNFLTIVQTMPPQMLEFHWKLLDKIYGMFFNGRNLDELYNPPAGGVELLTPEEEIDCVIAEQPIMARRGQNHGEHIKVLEDFMTNTQYALSEASFNILKSLIMSHYELMYQEMYEAQAMMALQATAMGPEGQGGVNKGRTPNASPFTQKSAPSSASLTRETSGEVA